MTTPFGTAGDAQVATGVAGAHWLVQLDFDAPEGTQYVTTAPVDVTVDGNTYIGLGNNVAVGTVQESEDTSARQVTLSMALVDTTLLGKVLGGVSAYRNRRARLYLQLFDAAFVPVGGPVLRWSGRMDPARVSRSARGGRIELPCTRSGMPHARNFQGLRHTHAQQQQRFPGNLCLQYLQDLTDKPFTWLSRRFQELE